MRNQHHIYFVQEGATGPIKIGLARNITSRLDALKCSNSNEINLLAVIPGSVQVERELHLRFAPLHIRGEWFRPGADLLDYIAGLPKAVLLDVQLRKTYATGKCPRDEALMVWSDPNISIRQAVGMLRGWTGKSLYAEFGPRPNGSQGRASAENGKSGGRPKTPFTEAQIEQARRAWESRKLKTWAEVRERLPKGFTTDRAYRLFGKRNST